VAPIFLLDTNICIYIRQKKPEVLRHFHKHSAGDIAISVITYGELMYGAAKNAHRLAAMGKLRELMLALPPLAMPEEAAGHYGILRAELESKGEMIGNNDLWIAAHAISSGLTLVTNTEKEFRHVRGLKTQNWAV
jgi:tRNA(fMet)-specific endonuclease VapC